MVLSLELHQYHIILYARNEHIVSEVQRALLHRYKYQLEAIVLLVQGLQVLRYCLDRCSVVVPAATAHCGIVFVSRRPFLPVSGSTTFTHSSMFASGDSPVP